MSENISNTTDVDYVQSTTSRQERRGSWTRALTITALSITAIGAIAHIEVSRLKDSQETEIGGVKTEVSAQGAAIRDPLIAEVRVANERLELCERVAASLGITEEDSGNVPRDQVAAGAPSTTTTSSSTSTTVAAQP